jgi:hypothetical protein
LSHNVHRDLCQQYEGHFDRDAREQLFFFGLERQLFGYWCLQPYLNGVCNRGSRIQAGIWIDGSLVWGGIGNSHQQSFGDQLPNYLLGRFCPEYAGYAHRKPRQQLRVCWVVGRLHGELEL